MKIQVNGPAGNVLFDNWEYFPSVEALRACRKCGYPVEIKEKVLTIGAKTDPRAIRTYIALDREAEEALIFLKLSL